MHNCISDNKFTSGKCTVPACCATNSIGYCVLILLTYVHGGNTMVYYKRVMWTMHACLTHTCSVPAQYSASNLVMPLLWFLLVVKKI